MGKSRCKGGDICTRPLSKAAQGPGRETSLPCSKHWLTPRTDFDHELLNVKNNDRTWAFLVVPLLTSGHSTPPQLGRRRRAGEVRLCRGTAIHLLGKRCQCGAHDAMYPLLSVICMLLYCSHHSSHSLPKSPGLFPRVVRFLDWGSPRRKK